MSGNREEHLSHLTEAERMMEDGFYHTEQTCPYCGEFGLPTENGCEWCDETEEENEPEN